MRPALDIPSDHLLQKTNFSLCQQVSVMALFSRKFQITSVRGGTWCLPPLLVARILSGLSLCRTCICYRGLCEFVCVSVLLSLEYTVSLETCTISRSHNLPISSSTEIHESWEYGFDEDIVFMVMNLTSPILCRNSPTSQSMINTIVGLSVQIQESFEEISHSDPKTGKQRPCILC